MLDQRTSVSIRPILGIPYFGGNMEEALALALPHAARRTPFAVYTPGATVAARAAKDEKLNALMKRGDLILPDGSGCLLAARLCGMAGLHRIAGIDFAEALLKDAEAFSARVFLYGAKAGVAERAASRLRARFPALIFASADGYGDDPWERIARFCPHIVCVCLGVGKQEAWIHTHKEAVGGVLLGLGGSLDVWAGSARRAPRLLQRVGLEWAYRTVREPHRISRLLPLPAYFGKCLLARRSSKCQKKE